VATDQLVRERRQPAAQQGVLPRPAQFLHRQLNQFGGSLEVARR
jgi:hypothetical protein